MGGRGGPLFFFPLLFLVWSLPCGFPSSCYRPLSGQPSVKNLDGIRRPMSWGELIAAGQILSSHGKSKGGRWIGGWVKSKKPGRACE